MSIPRTTNSFLKSDGTEVGYVGCLFDNEALFITHDYPAAESSQHETISIGMDQQIDALSIPFYFNLEKSVSFKTWLMGSVSGSFDEFIDPLRGALVDAAMNGRSHYNISALNFPDMCNKEQGQFGEDDVFQYLYLNGYIGENRLNEQDKFIEMTIEVWTARGRWDETNQTWTMPFGNRRIAFGYTNGGAPLFTGALNMLAQMSHFKFCVGPTMGRTLVGQEWQWSILNLDDTWIYGYASGVPVYFNVYGMTKVIGTLNYWNSRNWSRQGDIDPTDPWEEPDPYDPVDPPPNPPGPVDPVDPVDPVPDPDYPPIDGTSVGLYKVYKPSSSQLRSIAEKLWDPTVWNAIKQMFTNPMDSIFGLAIVPVEPHVSGSEDVYLGRYNTQVKAPRVSSEYVTVDCGSVFISKFYGSYLDHDPYTKYTLYLPYIGELDINADEITGKTVSVKYHCNVVTGDTVAVVLINNRACYTAMGNIIRQLPLSQVDFSSVIQTAVSAAATVLTSATSISSGIASEGLAIASGNVSAAIGGQSRINNAAAQGVASTLNNVASTKLGYKHAGKIGQGAAQMSVQKPFFTVSRPNLLLPEGVDGARNSSQKRYTGYPANYIDELRNFHGLTVVEECQLNMLGATDAEIAEATEILRGGVIL